MRIGRHENPPVLIVPTNIIDNHPFGVLEQEHAAQHVLFTEVPHQFRTAARIPNRDTKMVILNTAIIGHSRLSTGKHENPGLPIATHLVVRECDPAFGSVQHHSRQDAFHRSALRDDAGGVEYVERRMLIAADITERDAGNPPFRHLL